MAATPERGDKPPGGEKSPPGGCRLVNGPDPTNKTYPLQTDGYDRRRRGWKSSY